MLRSLLVILLFILSLLAILPTPTKNIWYVSILVTEFPWIFIFTNIAVLAWIINSKKTRSLQTVAAILSFIFFCYPVAGAYMVGSSLNERMEKVWGTGSTDLTGLQQSTPFSFWRMITGAINTDKIPFATLPYAVHTGVNLTLDFYKSQIPGMRPCIVVVHGGSWQQDDSQELPDINWYLARQGYNVASINYRLAPEFKSPAPVEDVAAAFTYLKSQATVLNIDTNNFVLLGRSAGGQIVLQSAYTLHEPGIKGVVSLYGPTDLTWAYSHPDNPMIMNSKKILSDFVGGTGQEVAQKYFEASPINYVTPATVPTLLIHGGNDAHVHYELSEMLDQKLDQNKVKHLLLGLPWATHGCEYSLHSPSGQLAKYVIERFIHDVVITRK